MSIRHIKQRTCKTRAARTVVVLLAAVGMLFCSGRARAGLQVYWPLETGSGATAYDSSPNGRNGTITGATWDTSVPSTLLGTSTRSLSFAGNDNDRVQSTWAGVLGTDPRTMSAWINTSDTQATIMSWGKNTDEQKWVFRTEGQVLRVENNGGWIKGTTDVVGNGWHHVAATWENDGSPNVNEVKFYVDGVPDTISSSGGNPVNTVANFDYRLGVAESNSKDYTGKIDDAAVWNQALTPIQISYLASGFKTPLNVLAQSPEYDYDAALDTTGNAIWESETTNTDRNWTFDKSAAPVSVSSWFGGITKAYDFGGSLGTDPTDATTGSYLGSAIDGPNNETASWEFWIKPDDLTGQEVLFESGGGTNGVSLVLNGATLEFTTKQGGNTDTATHTFSAVPNDFVQIVAVSDNATNGMYLYVNAQQVDSTPDTPDWTTGTDGSGLATVNNQLSGPYSGYGDFEGRMARIRMYDSALSGEDVVTTYRAMSGLNETGGWIVNLDAALDRPGSGTWYDLAVNRDGTFSGTPTPDLVSDTNWKLLTHSYDNPATMATFDGLNDTKDATFEIVFRPDSLAAGDKVTLWETGGTTIGSSFTLDGSTLQFAVKDSNLKTASFDIAPYFELDGSGNVTDGDFLHAMAVVDLTADTIGLYVNGRLVNTATGGNWSDWSGGDGAGLGTHSGSTAGALGDAYKNPFPGEIALFRLYGSGSGMKLTADQIAANFASVTGYDKVWETNGGNWHTAADWAPDGVPTASNNALIDAGLTSNLTGGTADANDLLLKGTLDWSGGSLAASNLIVDGGTVESSVTATSAGAVSLESQDGTFDTTSGTLTLSGDISGSGGMTKLGTGALTLSGANTYSGGTVNGDGTTANRGTIRLGSDPVGTVGSITSSPIGTGTLTFQAGWLTSDGTTARDILNPVVFGAGDGNAAYLGDPVNTGTLTFKGPGTLTANRGIHVESLVIYEGVLGGGSGGIDKKGPGKLILSGNNTYGTTTRVSSGILQVGNGGTSGSLGGGAVTIDNATLALGRSDGVTLTQAIDMLNGSKIDAMTGANTISGTLDMNDSSGMTVTLEVDGGATLILNSGNIGVDNTTIYLQGAGDGTINKSIASGAGVATIIKDGTGKWTLTSGANNWTVGPLTINAGTLALGAAGAVPNTPTIDVAAGATFDVSALPAPGFVLGAAQTIMGDGTVLGTIAGSGDVAPGTSPGILTASAINAGAGMAFSFEFTELGSPHYSTPPDIRNDVLALTDPTDPFSSTSLGPANVVDIYFNLTSLTSYGLYRGGFFTDRDIDFLDEIKDATFNYFVSGDGNGLARSYGGVNYYTLSEYGYWSVNISTVPDGDGYVMQLQTVPEPITILAVGVGISGLGGYIRKRRRR